MVQVRQPSGGLPAVGVQRQDVGDGAVERRRHARLRAELDNAAGEPAALRAGCRAPGRGASTTSCRRRAPSACASRLSAKSAGEADAVRAPDRHHLAHQVAEEGTRLRILADRADGRAHGGGRAREADQEDVLLPDLAADVGADSSALMPPALAGREESLGARRGEPSNSPKTRRCIGPVWRITPGGRSSLRRSRRRP